VPSTSTLAAFSIAAFLLVALPGPNMFYLLARSVSEGRRAAVVSALGTETGTLIHIAAAAAGLSALLASSATAFAFVKYAGAAYLVYLGIRRLLERTPPAAVVARGQPLARLLWRGAVVNVLNPKTALFFFAFLPQFVDPSRTVWSQVAVFGLVFVGLGLLSDGLYALTAGTLGRWLRRRPGILRWGSGSVYVGLGAVTALTRRA
jgi:threonine/homoserine/homoserine lactone efflux protein